MMKKPHVFSIVLILAIAVLVIAFTSQQTVIQSKASHAEELWRPPAMPTSRPRPSPLGRGRPPCADELRQMSQFHGFMDFIQDGTWTLRPPHSTVDCDVCHTNPG